MEVEKTPELERMVQITGGWKTFDEAGRCHTNSRCPSRYNPEVDPVWCYWDQHGIPHREDGHDLGEFGTVNVWRLNGESLYGRVLLWK